METVKKNHEFQRAYKKGKALVTRDLVIYVFKNKQSNLCRYGITTSKKIGNAVTRNRARRVIREAFRAVEPSIRPGYDFVFVARGRTARQKSTQIENLLREQLSPYVR